MVGELLTCLDKNGLRENTLVIFTSDNGGMLNRGGRDAMMAGHRINGPLLGFKFGAWEGGHRQGKRTSGPFATKGLRRSSSKQRS
jgi:arylsulfatase A-like enzyme